MLSAMAASMGRARHTDKTERCRGEREALREGVSRQGHDDAAPVANENYPCQNKQQMIETEQDMLDAQVQIAGRDLAGVGRGLN